MEGVRGHAGRKWLQYKEKHIGCWREGGRETGRGQLGVHRDARFLVFYTHTSLQSLVALACDLKMDEMESCSDTTKWSWFSLYCGAARMAKAIQNRTPFDDADN